MWNPNLLLSFIIAATVMDNIIPASLSVPLEDISYQDFNNGIKLLQQEGSSINAVVAKVVEHNGVIPSMRDPLTETISGCI